MEKIKLLIWDLDETFWNGTISDGEISPIDSNIKLIKELTDRGIVNSICSKNDFEQAKEALVKLDVWDYFVFPSIDWTAKGARVKQIIEDMNLRPVNVLFIDDNINNLQEASYFVDGLQTALPEELSQLLITEKSAFEGKDDSSHSRLNQYKILEKQTAERKSSSSNEAFLFQSDIQVELVTQCQDCIERIHEMIHRNNQLNYTKDRITIEEVSAIFTDPTIKSGYVKVHDKYGDHGIVGCYAVKDGVALQLVLSCRILGMGVEQWLYSELGYPKLTVVGDVAVDLEKGVRPAWINQDINRDSKDEDINNFTDMKKFIAYGTCPLRPVWAYIEPKLKEKRFSEMDPGPSILNLAVTKREDAETLNDWLSKIRLFDSRYTFDREIFSEQTGYVFVTLDGELSTWKYTSKITNKCFYMRNILTQNDVLPEMLDEYEREKVTCDDIESELSYLLDNLPNGTELLLMTVPEVEFPSLGKDREYYERIELNKVAEKLAKNHNNVYIIDIRKYAKESSDFFDTVSNHYNRAIGNMLADDILNHIFGSVQHETAAKKIHEDLESRASCVTQKIVPLGDVKISSCITNGEYYCEVTLDNAKDYQYSFTIVRDRFIENTTSYSDDNTLKFNVNKIGKWRVVVNIVNKTTNEKYKCNSSIIEYGKYRISEFFNDKYENYTLAKAGYNQYISDNEKADEITLSNQMLLSELIAMGVNPASYFLDKGINEIILFTDKRTGAVLFPLLKATPLKIKAVYTADHLFELHYGNYQRFPVNHINGKLDINSTDTVLFAFDHDQIKLFKSMFENYKCKIHYLNKVLCELKTKNYFTCLLENKKDMPKVFAVRTGKIKRFYAMTYRNITSSEKLLTDVNVSSIIKTANKSKEKLPKPLQEFDIDVINEVFKKPDFYEDQSDGNWRMKDVKGNYFNIENGFRKTVNAPDKYIGTIYLFGDIITLGCGVKDEDTIASKLQEMLDIPYRVVNYANAWQIAEYSRALKLMESIEYNENDIVIILISGWRHELVAPRPHWLEWDALEKPITKIDAFPLFAEPGRPDYFTSNSSYNPQCNEALAKLLKDNILNYVFKSSNVHLTNCIALHQALDELQSIKSELEKFKN